jgi:hypothetical protein
MFYVYVTRDATCAYFIHMYPYIYIVICSVKGVGCVCVRPLLAFERMDMVTFERMNRVTFRADG